MSSSATSELRHDEYHFLNYTIKQYSRGSGPPLTSKKARLIAAATQNDFLTLKELLDSPKWYEVRDKLGHNLLQIAILTENVEIFDYLLSLDDFPLEAVNDEGDTALIVALSYYVRDEPEAISYADFEELQEADSNTSYFRAIYSRYSYELIKKGANIDKITRKGNPLLHCALKRNFVSVAQLLIEKGADINELDSHGSTPLSVSLDNEEAITMLLCYGADPSIRDPYSHQTLLDRFLLRGNEWLVENLLYLTHDEWNLYKIDGNCLVQLAWKKSPVFHEVINLTSEIIITDISDWNCLALLYVDLEYLRIFIEKYPYFVKAVFQSYTRDSLRLMHERSIHFKNLEMLLDSPLCSDVIELIFKLECFFVGLTSFSYDGEPEYYIKIIYCLLSYGMSLRVYNLDHIYRVTGYSEDFKNLVLMDLHQRSHNDMNFTSIIPRLIYDVTFDPHNDARDLDFFFFGSRNWDLLFHYFAHPKFQEIYKNLKCPKVSSCGTQCNCRVCVFRSQLPQIPLLQELARDTFRRFFINIFEIKTAKKFYSLIKLLPVSSVHKKIITFESKLY